LAVDESNVFKILLLIVITVLAISFYLGIVEPLDFLRAFLYAVVVVLAGVVLKMIQKCEKDATA